MLDTILAAVAAVVWIAAYGVYFSGDLRRWWRGRHRRRAAIAAQREEARRTYAAWVRNIPPPPSRAPILPAPPLVSPRPPNGSGGVVVPFPRTAGSRR